MKRDTSELPISADCYAVIDDKNLAIFINGKKDTYTLVSDKYIKIRSETSTTTPTEITCLDYAQITDLPTSYDFITPIYHTIAIASAIVIFWGAYRLILRPWFRKKA
jgi:hypothetical protein